MIIFLNIICNYARKIEWCVSPNLTPQTAGDKVKSHLTTIISDKYLSVMAKIGYIMAISQYDRLEEDQKWMNDYGCIRIVEE